MNLISGQLLGYVIMQLLFCYLIYSYAKNNLEPKPYLWIIASLIIPFIVVWIWLYIRKRKRLSLGDRE